jgi:putative transposase
VRRILRAQLGWAPDERTLCRHFARLGLIGGTLPEAPTIFGRFGASRPNGQTPRWQGLPGGH